MTETIDGAAVDEAIELIDRSLGQLQNRELVAGAEMADLLLDIRMLLSASERTEPATVV